MEVLSFLTSHFFSEHCLSCGEELSKVHMGSVCDKCLSKINFIKGEFCKQCGGELDTILECCSKCLEFGIRPWDKAISVMKLEGTALDIIHKYKYSNQFELAEFLTQITINRINEIELEFDYITPIPIHIIRYFTRGYNQTELITKKLSKEFNKPMLKLLKRKKYTKKQAKLGKEDRKGNLIDAFSFKDRVKNKNCSILLIDDVFTTGATLSEATKVLKANGVAEVKVLTLARR